MLLIELVYNIVYYQKPTTGYIITPELDWLIIVLSTPIQKMAMQKSNIDHM